MWAVRGAPDVFARKEKFTTPPEEAPIVSQVWSLVGAKTPLRGVVAGSTCTVSAPAAPASVKLVEFTKAKVIPLTSNPYVSTK
jgi:hypothetical protein